MLHVFFKICLVHLTPNETFGVKDGVGRVGVECVLGRVTDKSFIIREADPGRCYPMTLIVGNNLDTTAPLYTVPNVRKGQRNSV